MPDHPYPPTCRERQDAEILALQMTCRELQETINHLTHIIEDILTHVSALEAAAAVNVPVAGTVVWDTGAVTWTNEPPFVHSPGYEEETP